VAYDTEYTSDSEGESTGRRDRVDSSRSLKRLRNAIEWSRRKLLPFREQRVNAIREFVGQHYSDNGSNDRVPFNFLEIATSIYTSQLASNNPKVMVSTPHAQLKTSAYDLQLAVNILMQEIQIHKTLRKAVLEALYGMGVVKVGLEQGAQVEIGGFLHDVGQPFCDVVGLDDWVHDMSAKRYEEVSFAGNRYRIPFYQLSESGLYDPKVVANLQPTNSSHYNLYNEGGDERAENLAKGHDSNPDEYLDYIELWDLWLPHDNKIITIPTEGESEPLRVVEWSGPEEGPYHILQFTDVPGNMMPLPPVSVWIDMHELANRIFRKLGRQAERQKTILGVRGTAAEDGERIVRANDGEAILLDNPEAAREYKFGGIDQTSLAFLIQLRQMFSYQAGNLDVLGGLGPQTQTVGQERLLAASASKRMGDMQGRMMSFTREVVRSLAKYLWYDPFITLPLVKREPGIELGITVEWGPEQREGDFVYDIEIAPYSMKEDSPGDKLNVIMQFLNTMAPFMPMMEQQGLAFDFEGIARKFAQYTNLDDLDEIMTFMGEPLGLGEPMSGGRGGEARQSPSTTRTNVRVNRPGTTQGGQEQAMVAQLLGQGKQPSEQAAMTRDVS